MKLAILIIIALCQMAIMALTLDTWRMDKQFFNDNYLEENSSQVEEPEEMEV